MNAGSTGGAGFLEASSSSDESSSDEGAGGSGGEERLASGTLSSHNLERLSPYHLAKHDAMRLQDTVAMESRMRDLGYREGKLELVDANEFAQVCFERGVLKGARCSAPAGQLRGWSLCCQHLTRKLRGVDCAYDDLLRSTTHGFDGLEDPTKVTPELERLASSSSIEQGCRKIL